MISERSEEIVSRRAALVWDSLRFWSFWFAKGRLVISERSEEIVSRRAVKGFGVIFGKGMGKICELWEVLNYENHDV